MVCLHAPVAKIPMSGPPRPDLLVRKTLPRHFYINSITALSSSHCLMCILICSLGVLYSIKKSGIDAFFVHSCPVKTEPPGLHTRAAPPCKISSISYTQSDLHAVVHLGPTHINFISCRARTKSPTANLADLILVWRLCASRLCFLFRWHLCLKSLLVF